MNTAQLTYDGARAVQGRTEKTQSESQENLHRAVRTLGAFRERYETGRNAGSGYLRSYTVQVALGYTDMLWITAAIEALEKAIADSATGPAP